MIKNNLLVLSLENNLTKQTKQKLAETLDLFFVDADDILQYNMIDDDMLETCGKEYFEKEQKKVLLGLAEYENSLVSGRFNLFFKDDMIKNFQSKFIVIYLRVDKKLLNEYQSNKKFTVLNQSKNNLLAFDVEDKILCKNADIVVKTTNNDDENIKNFKQQLLKFVEAK